MSLTQEQIKHIARLSKLKIPNEDLDRYVTEINSIMQYIDTLNEIPDSELEWIELNSNLKLKLRKDEITNLWITSGELLACSNNDIINNSIVLDKILKK